MAYDVDRPPGAFAKQREKSHARVALAFLVLGALPAVLALLLLATGTFGPVEIAGLLGAQFVASRFFDVRLGRAISWGKGGNAEIAVGNELATLRADGYVVLHDLDRVVRGNVDHLVAGPTGAFMIETKFRRYEIRDLTKAEGVARTLAQRLNVERVQPVICFGSRSYGPIRVRGVAVMGREQVVSYIRAQTNPVVAFEQLTRFADTQ